MGSSNPSPGEAGRFRNLEMVMLSPTAFCLWVVKRAPRHKWRERRITFHSKDISVIQQWVEKVQEILTKPGVHEYQIACSCCVSHIFLLKVLKPHLCSKSYTMSKLAIIYFKSIIIIFNL